MKSVGYGLIYLRLERKYSNLTNGIKINAPNRLWVSDITYLPFMHGYAYLSLVTDAYSRKIVGWKLHPSLQLEGALAALKMALKANKVAQNLIHHSDRDGPPLRRSILRSSIHGSTAKK